MNEYIDPRVSELMSRVGRKNTAPELKVRSELHRAGFRFRLHATSLPGTPDLVFPSRKAAIFIHGCFWHRHKGCKGASFPKIRKEFWARKFAANEERDARQIKDLRAMGWRVLVLWECDVKSGLFLSKATRFLNKLR